MKKSLISSALLVVTLLLVACSEDSDTPLFENANPFPNQQSAVYGGAENWLCRPDLPAADNICTTNLDATIVNADGATSIEKHAASTEPAVDCFYVYPTVSGDESGNSDLVEGDSEIFTVVNQAARYNRLCRVFAPIYRQTTVASIFNPAVEGDRELAYNDVLDSFREYIAQHSDGRGFILVGHSQGAGHLRRLLDEVIEEEPKLASRLIAAHLLGSSPQKPVGADVGGSFDSTPVCRTADQTGCVVSFGSYRDSDPFLAAGAVVFGRPDTEAGTEAICTHPTALSGGAAPLDGYFANASTPALAAVIKNNAPGGPFADPAARSTITTPFYKMPGFLRGECKTSAEGINYLEVTALADPADPRADSFNGEFFGGDGWGLHLMDMTISMGNLLDLAEAQAASWLVQN